MTSLWLKTPKNHAVMRFSGFFHALIFLSALTEFNEICANLFQFIGDKSG